MVGEKTARAPTCARTRPCRSCFSTPDRWAAQCVGCTQLAGRDLRSDRTHQPAAAFRILREELAGPASEPASSAHPSGLRSEPRDADLALLGGLARLWRVRRRLRRGPPVTVGARHPSLRAASDAEVLVEPVLGLEASSRSAARSRPQGAIVIKANSPRERLRGELRTASPRRSGRGTRSPRGSSERSVAWRTAFGPSRYPAAAAAARPGTRPTPDPRSPGAQLLVADDRFVARVGLA